MRKNLFCMILVVLLISMAFNIYAEERKVYKSSYFNFTINYPSDWQVQEISGLVAFKSPLESEEDNFSENVNVIVENLTATPMSLEDYEAISLMNAPKLLPDFRLLEEGKTIVDGKDAFFTIYKSSSDVGDLRYKAYTFMSNSTAYTLTYTAKEEDFDKYLTEAENIMQSIRISLSQN